MSNQVNLNLNPQNIIILNNNNNMSNLKVYNKITKRNIRLFKSGTNKPTKYIINALKKNPNALKLINPTKQQINNLVLPNGYGLNLNNGNVMKIWKGTQQKAKYFNKDLKKQLKNNPQGVKLFITNKIYNDRTGRLIKKKNLLTKKGKVRKRYKDLYIFNEGKIIKKPKTSFNDISGVITRSGGLNKSIIFSTPQTQISNIDEFVKTIRDYANTKVPYDLRTRKNRKVKLRFNNEFRIIPIDKLDNLQEYLTDWKGKTWGSNTTDISPENLDMGWFRLVYIGSGKSIGGGKNRSAFKSKYWKTDNAPSKNNLCFEANLNRGCKLGKVAKTIRKEMIKFSNGDIKEKETIKLHQIEFYENHFKICINIWEDTPHIKTIEKEINGIYESVDIIKPNLIRESNKTYDNEINLLLKNEHYAFIIGKKLRKGELSEKQILKLEELDKEYESKKRKKLEKYKWWKEQKKILTKEEYDELVKKHKGSGMKKTKFKELAVFFDIETVFDRNDVNYLKCYSCAWFVWDMDKPFKYDEEIHLKECYYYQENGLIKLLHFLLCPPKDCRYKPIGFNNSRFDNFALCEEALNQGILRNAFFVDGSILYNVVEGCSPTWDTCRFLPPMSLDKACKGFNTNPKKQKDLINHYEIQCYFERNGMKGLKKLLDNNNDLVKYNKLDVLCLCDLTQKIRNSFLKMTGEDVFKKYTISSFGWAYGLKLWKKNNYKILPPRTYEDDCFFRESLTAGRTQSFYGKIDLKMPLAMCDIKSLYPTVMGNYGSLGSPNYCPYPLGEYRRTKKYIEKRLGIYEVYINHQNTKWKNENVLNNAFKKLKLKYGYDLYRKYAPCVIPLRQKDKPLNWFYRGEMGRTFEEYEKNENKENRKVLTSVDIEVLRNATGDKNCVIIYEGVYWEEQDTEIFKPYLEPFKKGKSKQDKLKSDRKKLIKEKGIIKNNILINDGEIREIMIKEYGEDYNEAERETNKASLNCYSGKLLEKLHAEKQGIFTTKKFLEWEQNENISNLDILDFGRGFCLVSGKLDLNEVFTTMKKVKPCYLGMFVYSYARRLMYEKVLNNYIVFYIDTDSACMPYFEWNRMIEDYRGKGFIDTGDFGCMEEEVMGKDEFGKDIPAERLIAISPKNYLVENLKCEKLSKRKFKGVRKTDYYLPLSYFHKNKDKAVEIVRNLSQDNIRRFRECKCCIKCINEYMKDKNMNCKNCKNMNSLLRKCYTTEMFEYLVRGDKIVVFCSMINKIKYKIGGMVDWKHKEHFKKNGYDLNAVKMNEVFKFYKHKHKDKICLSYENNKGSDVVYNDGLREVDEKELIECFKLKQQYLAKII